MAQKRNKIPQTFTFPRELLDRLEAFRKAQPVPPTKNAVVEQALNEFLSRPFAKDPAG